jgi:hypothetical protein
MEFLSLLELILSIRTEHATYRAKRLGKDEQCNDGATIFGSFFKCHHINPNEHT